MKSGPAVGDADRTVLLRAGGAGGERVRLSVYDVVNGTFATSRTFYYRQRLDTEALRESLRRTLAHYPLFTGRLERDADGGLSVVCNDAGAVFTESHCDRPMPDYGPGHSARDDLRRYLHSVNPFRVVGHDTPLLTVKVTHMRGGGSVLGASVNHSVADGRGFLDFLVHWSRTHRGQDHVAPPHDRAVLNGLAAGTVPAPQDPQYVVVTGRAKFGFIWRVNARARRVRTLTTRFSSAEVLALREAARAGGDNARATSGDALGAHVWRVLGALRDRGPEATERLGIVVGLRAALSESLPHGYSGNAVSNTTAALPARALREETLAHTAAVVRDALVRVTPRRIREEVAFLDAQRDARRLNRVLTRMSLDAFESTVALNNVSRLPMYAIDFGTGRPFWFEYPASPIPWTVLITPTPDGEYSRDVHLSVPREAAEALRAPEWVRRLHPRDHSLDRP
ncbi:acyltransferase [Streptomyces sp. ALI-76-A]|uniref:acyltransferase n=1 Tax=Streptomyces sp. ALI-76-A TaxID=3025736 RepID=UPI00256ED673|nr:acyltransferase [Streptomyces sp. ALI-76-A]MDL5205958.1 acyltransferase [Streptomyces sp. ALI-76-A]